MDDYFNNPFMKMELPGLKNQPRETISNSADIEMSGRTVSNQFELDLYLGLLKPYLKVSITLKKD